MQTKTTTSRMSLSAALAGSILLWNATPSHATCSDTPYLASVCITAATYCPRGYAEANGQLLPINQYAALFSLVGTTYGGDGRASFALPNLQGRTPVGIGMGTGLSRVVLGEQRGLEQRTLGIAQLPSHTHNAAFNPAPGGGLQASTKDGDSPTPASDSYLGKLAIKSIGSPPNLYTTDDSSLTPIKGLGITGAVSVENSGGSQSFPIIPPQLGLRYCIAVEGIFPPRP